MPNYAQAAIQIRQKKEREAKEKELRAEIENRNQEGDIGPAVEQKVTNIFQQIYNLLALSFFFLMM